MRHSRPGRAPYGIIGGGKASSHLQAYFRLLKTPYIVWRRGSGRAMSEALADCAKIFVLVSDSELEAVIGADPFLKGRVLLHFSGSMTVPGAFGLHPLMPLSSRPMTLEEYRAVPFALDAGSPPLRALVPEFRNPFFRVRKGKKAFYHALCVLGGNLPFILWRKAMDGLRGEFKVPEKHVRAYFRAALANFEHDPRSGLTGPLQRKDARTIKTDLEALRGDSFRGVYSAFARALGHKGARICG
ncbi:MAG TPA: DUF2520 domain-containing protein [Elusimicrobiales bacterium]|nr:DUF2520 domain-containing protein [Elusimicrobiales bacterium]